MRPPPHRRDQPDPAARRSIDTKPTPDGPGGPPAPAAPRPPAGGRPAWVGPSSADQAMPGQQRRRGHQPTRPNLPRYQPGQRGQQGTVGPDEPRPPDLATQDRHLVTQHQQLRRLATSLRVSRTSQPNTHTMTKYTNRSPHGSDHAHRGRRRTRRSAARHRVLARHRLRQSTPLEGRSRHASRLSRQRVAGRDGVVAMM